MKYLKEAQRVSILKRISLCFLSLGLLFNLACSHKFVKLESPVNAKITNLTLCVKLHTGDNVEKFTVYAQVDKENRRAILDGVGKFDKYVFHMDINKDNFYFEDLVNKEKKSGKLEEFEPMPLKEKDIFEEVDIKKPQPIIFTSDKKGTKLEIRVKEQN